jgi:ribosome-dependent ATPase
VDIELKKGEILGLLGANGAGKTTLIKMLLGLYPIDKGELSILGRHIVSNKDRLFLKEKIGYMSQLFSLYDDLTVRENMLYFGKIRKLNHLHDKVIEFSNMLGFSEYLDFLPKDLPLGINQRFSLSLAIMHEPAILFLDEPTSGVDVIARSQFWKLLTEIKEKWKISILVTTHYMNEAEYCDRVVVLKSGEKIVDSSVESLKTKFNNIDFEDIFFEIYKGNL